MGRNSLFYCVLLAFISGCGSLGPAPRAPVQPPAAPIAKSPAPPRAERSEALLQALLALGLDYRYGGNSHVTGFDCSGLVAHIYLEAWNIRLPRNTSGQSQAGTPVSLAEL